MSHYFSVRPDTPSQPAEVRLDLPDLSVGLRTDRGVFSRDRIDPGTKLLLLHGPPATETGTIVDLGCGYGAIAIALALRAPRAPIVAVDSNERARALCQTNAAAVGVSVEVLAPDEVPPDLTADQIWSNPPIRIGKAALHALLGDWLPRLSPGGLAVLVVQRNLGADSLARWLSAQGWEVCRRHASGGYRILEVSRAQGE
jgi:16S rRNA (guanine1207-N2)-methyltransferase